MKLIHRKLITSTVNISAICNPICDRAKDALEEDQDDSPYTCLGICSNICPSYCPPISYDLDDDHNTNTSKKLLHESLSICLSILGLAFFIFCLYNIYKHYKNRTNSRTRLLSQGEQRTDDHDEFLDEEHGPVIDHPIWYIRTIGLETSVINTIAVCKYKKGEGVVEGTECSVCLSEFEDDESLRLLPKCNHAFHLPCIDTWLRSHTNCPMCRAPIVANTNGNNLSPIVEQSVEENRVAISDVSEEIVRGNGENDEEIDLGIGISEKGIESSERGMGIRSENDGQSMRRSVSMDSLLAFKLSIAIANAHLGEFERGSSSCLGKGDDNETNTIVVQKRRDLNHGLLKSIQKGPVFMKRSFSCSLFSRHSQNRDSMMPL